MRVPRLQENTRLMSQNLLKDYLQNTVLSPNTVSQTPLITYKVKIKQRVAMPVPVRRTAGRGERAARI